MAAPDTGGIPTTIQHTRFVRDELQRAFHRRAPKPLWPYASSSRCALAAARSARSWRFLCVQERLLRSCFLGNAQQRTARLRSAGPTEGTSAARRAPRWERQGPVCLGWLYHHLRHPPRAGTRSARRASRARYSTELEQSPAGWTTILECGARWRPPAAAQRQLYRYPRNSLCSQ